MTKSGQRWAKFGKKWPEPVKHWASLANLGQLRPNWNRSRPAWQISSEICPPTGRTLNEQYPVLAFGSKTTGFRNSQISLCVEILPGEAAEWTFSTTFDALTHHHAAAGASLPMPAAVLKGQRWTKILRNDSWRGGSSPLGSTWRGNRHGHDPTTQTVRFGQLRPRPQPSPGCSPCVCVCVTHDCGESRFGLLGSESTPQGPRETCRTPRVYVHVSRSSSVRA